MSSRLDFLRAFFGAILFALALSAAPARAQDDAPVAYRVVKGDTLYTLAQKYMRVPANAIEVQLLNRIANPRRLPIGRILRIPRHVLRYNPVPLNIAAFSGPVQVDGGAPQVGGTLREGQTIATGPNGFITFRSAFGGRFTMPSNSTMRLDRARRYILGDILDVDFRMLKGRGEASSPALKDQDRLRLGTPKSTTAVRGTDFRVGYLEEAGISITEVTEGSVALSAGEDTSVTEAGFGVASTDAGIAEREALLPPVEFVDPGRIQTDEALSFAFEPVPGAKAYRVQLARDAGFVDILTETITAEATVGFPGLDDGRYFVRGRGISANAIEGFSRSYSFRRKRLGVAGSAEPSPLDDGFLFKWAPVGEGPATFAFQLWKEGAPQDLLFDETGLSQMSLVVTDLAPATYQWRVAVMQADAEDGLIKVWGAPESLVVSE